MNNIIIEETKSTPKVVLDFTNNIYKIEGQSYPENTQEFFSPIILAIDEYLKNSVNQFILDIKLQYINTSSTMFIMLLFEKIDDHYKSKTQELKVNWHCDKENELAIECGNEFKEDVSFPFEVIIDN